MGDARVRLSLRMLSARCWALAVFGLFAVPMLGVWAYVGTIHDDALSGTIAHVSEQSAQRLQEQLTFRVALAEALARQMEAGAVQGDAAYVAHARALQQRFPGYLAINRVDPAGRIVQVVPEGPNAPALGRLLGDHPEAGAVFREAERTGALAVTGPVTLFQGGKGLAAYVPIHGGRAGYVNAVFRVRPVLEHVAAAHGGDYRVELRFDDALVEAVAAEHGDERWARSSALEVGGRSWQVRMVPTSAFVHAHHTNERWVLLVLGFLASVAAGAVAYVRAVERERRHEHALRLARMQRMEAVGTLAGGVAHDVNNLLTVVLSTLELTLEDLDGPSEVREDLESLLDMCRDTGGLTTQLLAMARGARASQDPDARVVPDDELETVATLLRRTVRAPVRLEVHTGAAGVAIPGDATLLRQMVVNLVLNSRDAMPQGGTVTLRTAVVSLDGRSMLQLVVEDEGVGMDAPTAAKVFEPFFTTKGPKEGTGLGLAMVSTTVQGMGGTVALHTAPGEGARFELAFPVAP